MAKKQIGLGKGIESILGIGSTPLPEGVRRPVGYLNKDIAESSARQDNADVLRIPVDRISANPFQPRTVFDAEALAELAESIRSLGLIQPITVRKTSDGKYQIISGERRFRACQAAGMSMIPAYVRDASDKGMLEMAIVENIQRENLDPVETALSYQRLQDEYGMTQEQLSERMGKKRATIANFLRLLKLPVKVQHDLKVGLLSVGHAKALLSLEDSETQERLADMVLADNLNVRQLEDLVKRVQVGIGACARKSSVKGRQVPLSEACGRLRDAVGGYFASGVSIVRKPSGKGVLTVKFSSDSEIENFLAALRK